MLCLVKEIRIAHRSGKKEAMDKTAEKWVNLHITIFSDIIPWTVSKKLENLKILCLRDNGYLTL